MRLHLFIALILSPIFTYSQGLEYDINNDGELSFSFDQNFIQNKKIKTITSEFSKKKPNEVVKPQGQNSKRISYTTEGQISEFKSQTYISSSRIKKHKKFFYTDSVLTQALELDHIGYFSEFHTYSSDTCFVNIYRSDDYKDYSHTAQDSTFMTSKVFITAGETTRELNSKFIEVNKRTLSYDSLGLLKREFTQHTFSPLLIDKHYDYNQQGKVSEIELATITTRKTFEFIYDRLASLQTVEYYLDDKLVTKYEVVYNSDGWVTAFLKHDVASHVIEIEKLAYTFHS